MPSLGAVFDQDGLLSGALPGYRPRASQREMARAVSDALRCRGTLLVESGTGTGKTFAYLVPALLAGGRVVISTGTRHLQDQIHSRDLPLVTRALGAGVSAALLKGRSNYLCRYRLERAATGGQFSTRVDAAHLARIVAWAGSTRSGDIAEVRDVPEDSAVWPAVTSTADNCLGARCPEYEGCHVNAARRSALSADVTVINHHLFFADLTLRDDGFGRLLPGADAIIFDEAHQLPQVATQFFGSTLTSHQLVSLCRDVVAEDVRAPSGLKDLRDRAGSLERRVLDLRIALGDTARREMLDPCFERASFGQAFDAFELELNEFADALAAVSGASEGFANCAARCAVLAERADEIRNRAPGSIGWYETGPRSLSLHVTPIDIAAQFTGRLANAGDDGMPPALVFTSATLAVAGDFSHFTRCLGLADADTAAWESPFDYAQQSLLYLPRGLPAPDAPDYTLRVIDAALPVIAASGGRAFLLFTSHRALRIAAERLKDVLPYPLLVQGDMPRTALLERFRALGNAVLLGSASFWEGVDVRGPALSCVIIDKLPFAPPDDPVMRARAEALEMEGLNPFIELQLPAAVIALKQGVGRLIRDDDDRGVLMICDPRLTERSYGRVFLSSLPPMRRTSDIADVEAFYAPAVN